MHLRWTYPNGHFGDPALYVWEINTRNALLIDCGDLSQFSTRQLFKVSHIFVSHCHIDHFFGFDHFLRIHVGSEKTITIMGPPHTSARVAGKLKGYTWNLIWDKNLEFIVVDLDLLKKQKTTTHFHAKNAFLAGDSEVEELNITAPIFESENFIVSTAVLDHRTPSMAYVIEEKKNFSVNKEKLVEMGFKTGPWLNALKVAYLNGGFEQPITTERVDGTSAVHRASELAEWLLAPRHGYKIAYVTDGAANAENFKTLLPLIENADVLVAETCFTEQDRALADETKHFTADFIAGLATAAKVKKLKPFHFSKRYLGRDSEVFTELSQQFPGEIQS